MRDAVGKNVGHDEDIKSIRAVMKQDDDLTKSMVREIKAIKIHNEDGLDAAASLMQDYVDQAMQIDTQFCPRDFAEAYYRNITAWAAMPVKYEFSSVWFEIRDQLVVNG